MKFADLIQASIAVILRLMQLTYASGLLGLLIIVLYIPSTFIFLPITSRLDNVESTRLLNTILPCLLVLAATYWYFLKAELIKMNRWNTEKRLIFATALMAIGNIGPTVYVSARLRVDEALSHANLFPLFLFTVIFYLLGALCGFRLSRYKN